MSDRDGSSQGVNFGIDGAPQKSISNTDTEEIQQVTQKALLGKPFLGARYCVDTVGLNAEKIRRYVRYHEKREKQIEQQQLKF